ncbi:hypothetical protein PMAYCL1PPCAC_25852, partial [Pristionchus mayeri]
TPPPMRSYAILLLNNAFVDILSAVASILGIARLPFLRDGPSQVYVFLGTCSHIGRWFCHMCQTIHIFCVCHSTVILLHSFCFRLYILRDRTVNVTIPSERVTLFICVALYGPTICMMYLFYASFEYPPTALMTALHFDQYPTTWVFERARHYFVIAISCVVSVSPAPMVIIFFVRRRLISEISKMVS